MPRSNKTDARLVAYVSAEVADEVKAAARADHRSDSQWLRIAVTEKLERDGRNRALRAGRGADQMRTDGASLPPAFRD